MPRSKYSYNGPVKKFDDFIEFHWSGSTYASSEIQARNNLTYRYKTRHNMTANTVICLTGKITKE